MGNCISGKITLTVDDKVSLELSKQKGQNVEVNLVSLLDKYDKLNKKDKDYVKNEVKTYLQLDS